MPIEMNPPMAAILVIGETAWIFAIAAIVWLTMQRFLPRVMAWPGLIVLASVAVALFAHHGLDSGTPALGFSIVVSSGLSLGWSCSAMLVWLLTGRSSHHTPVRLSFVSTAHLSALLLGVGAFVQLALVVVIRILQFTVSVATDAPWQSLKAYELGTTGVASCSFLILSCALAWTTTRIARLGTCLLWITALSATWACLLPDLYRVTERGTIDRAGGMLVLMAGLAVLLAVAMVASGPFERRGFGRGQQFQDPIIAATLRAMPGLRSTCMVLGFGVMVLACYHLSVPLFLKFGGFRSSAALITVSAALAGACCLGLAKRSWHAQLVDTGMALWSLALCGAVTVLIPSEPQALTVRYPLMFAAIITALALATVGWSTATFRFRLQASDTEKPNLASRLAPRSHRSAFLSASLALLVATLLAVWPRLPAIATMDHEFGRVAVGMGANILLLLALLRSSRLMRQPMFHILTIFSVATLVGFMVVRMMPFRSEIGTGL